MKSVDIIHKLQLICHSKSKTELEQGSLNDNKQIYENQVLYTHYHNDKLVLMINILNWNTSEARMFG